MKVIWKFMLFPLVALSFPMGAPGETTLSHPLGFEKTEEGVRARLREFAPNPEREKTIDALVRQLDHQDFGLRLQATDRLMKMPRLPHKSLKQTATSASAETRMRIAQILARNTDTMDLKILKGTLSTIVQSRLDGLGPEVLESFSRSGDLLPDRPNLWSQALITTAGEEELEVLSTFLSHQIPFFREVAATVVAARKPAEESLKLLEPLLKDAETPLRMQVARYFFEQRHAASLPVLLDLLNNPDWGFRAGSHALLRTLSEESLGYFSSGTPEKRVPAIKKWQDWLQTN
ncbi:MAG: hypothetical protein AAF492_24695, partial [Verrucomicrobiota bacterium]